MLSANAMGTPPLNYRQTVRQFDPGKILPTRADHDVCALNKVKQGPKWTKKRAKNTGCFFNWASPEFAKCLPVSN